MMNEEIKYEMVIYTKDNNEKVRIGAAIHNQLRGNPDYIDSNIILNIDEDCTVYLTVMNDCNNFPTVTLPF